MTETEKPEYFDASYGFTCWELERLCTDCLVPLNTNGRVIWCAECGHFEKMKKKRTGGKDA